MNLRSDIGHAFVRNAICVSLILLASTGFSFGSVQAGNCRGGADCLICAQQPHRHFAGAPVRFDNADCTSAGQNSTCGFETAQDAEKFFGIVSSVRTFQPARLAILSGASGEDSQGRLSIGLVTANLSSDPGPKNPIYIRNHSLLC